MDTEQERQEFEKWLHADKWLILRLAGMKKATESVFNLWQQLRTLEREKVELEKEIEFYKASMVRIANSQDITDPIELIARAKNNEQTYVDILLEVIAERKNFLTAQLTQMAEAIVKNWKGKCEIGDYQCVHCRHWIGKTSGETHKSTCIVLTAQSILEKKG